MKTVGRTVTVLLVLILAVSGCTKSGRDKNAPIPTDSHTPSQIPYHTVEMYFVGDTPKGFRLFSEKYIFQSEGDLATATLDRLISGRAQPKDPDYVNLWGNGTSLNAYTEDGSVGVVDLTMGRLNVGAESESRAIEQILWTLGAIEPSVTAIKLLVDGRPIESLAGHVDASKEIVKTSDYEVLSDVQITSMIEGETVSNPIEVVGQSCTFEANVVWVLRKSDRVLKRSSTIAETACPDRSNWRVQLDNLAPGKYTFTVEDFSAKDGSLSARDDKNFTVTAT